MAAGDPNLSAYNTRVNRIEEIDARSKRNKVEEEEKDF